jgi:hypothetical protein
MRADAAPSRFGVADICIDGGSFGEELDIATPKIFRSHPVRIGSTLLIFLNSRPRFYAVNLAQLAHAALT